VLYALILSVGRDPLPGQQTRFSAPQLEKPTTPKPLPSIPNIANGEAPNIESTRDERTQIAIQIKNTTGLLGVGDAGIATFHTETGGDFHWLPLSNATKALDGSLRMNASAAIGTRLTITLSSSREYARHGYISRQIVDVNAPGDGPRPVASLNGLMHEVQINLPTNTERAGPLRLKRVDDPRWLPILNSTSGLNLQRGVITRLQLAPGNYELQDPLAKDRRQAFSVPEATVVEVSPVLAPAEDGRL